MASLCVPCHNGEVGSRSIMLLAATAAAVSCSSGGAGTASGLHGLVTRGPTAPVCRTGVPCSRPAAHVVVQFVREGRVAGTARTDAKGGYRIVLPADAYTLRIARRFGVSISPKQALVRTAAMRRLDLRIDTGIR
jgi:hypothetical protein